MKHTSTRLFFWISLILFIFGILCLSIYFLLEVNRATQKITNSDSEDTSLFDTISDLTSTPEMSALRGYDDGRVNILLLGVAGTEKEGARLTDTIMITSIDTTSNKVSLLSIPRDLLIPTKDGTFKVNSLLNLGEERDRHTELSRAAISHVTGLDIHYDVIMDFEGFEKIVDTLGGINITVPREIYDERYPGPGYSYETFHITEGFQTLDGETALKYARTRYEDPESDFGRAKRQQAILSALRNKALSRQMLNPQKIISLLDVLSDHIRTDITPQDMRAFVALMKNVDTQNITNLVYDAWQPQSLLVSVQYNTGRYILPGLAPRIGNWSETRQAAADIFSRDARERRKREVLDEDPRIHILIPENATFVTRNRLRLILEETGFDDITFTDVSEESNSDQELDSQEKVSSPLFKTTIYDHSDGRHPFSLDAALSALTATRTTTELFSETPLSQSALQEPYTLSIYLGADMIDKLSYTEISQDDFNKKNEEDLVLPQAQPATQEPTPTPTENTDDEESKDQS